MSVEPLVLTPAEMAVVFQHLLGPAEAEGGLLGDLDLRPPALDAARARLLDRRLLRPAPDRASAKSFIAPGVRTLLDAVTRPLMLCVLQIMRPGQDERGAYFSWTPEMLVFNAVDQRGNHLLEPLPELGMIADRVLDMCGLLDFKPGTSMPAGSAPYAAGKVASLRAVLMTVASVRTAHEKVQGLAWLLSAGRLWLIAPHVAGAAGAAPSSAARSEAGLRELSPADLRAAILAEAQQAVVHTRAVLQAAVA
jgi:hypothetical protein